MVHDRAKWRRTARRAALVLIAAALPFACTDGPAVHAQSLMRTPNLNIQPRTPSINTTVRAPNLNTTIRTPSINPTV
jgi:hypothetical protein